MNKNMNWRAAVATLLAAGMLVPAAAAQEGTYISDSVTITPVATQEEPQASKTLGIQQLYMQVGSRTAAVGETVTASLVLRLDNADGELEPFGIWFDLSEMSQVDVKTNGNGVDCTYSGGTLWVENGVASGGRVLAGNRSVEFSVSFVPFPSGEGADTAAISFGLLNASGARVGLETRSEGDVIIRDRLRISRAEAEGEMHEETPEGESTPMPTPEPTPIPTPEPLPMAQPRELRLHASKAASEVFIGDTVVLTAELIGYDGLQVRIQWQNCHDGVWSNVEGENATTLTILVTEKNAADSWRYDVTVLTDTPAADAGEEPAVDGGPAPEAPEQPQEIAPEA